MEDVRQVDPKASSNELYHILEKLVALHRNLVDVLREEYVHMGAVDLNGLAETARTKEVLLSEVWNLEQLRLKISATLAGVMNIPQGDASLMRLAEAMPGAEGERLRVIRTALNMLVTQAKELNSKNMVFAQSSLERLEEMKRNALGLGKTAIKENYSNSGVRQPSHEKGGRLLSTEA